MSALSWLRLARRVPGLASQSELPNLETLVESEASKPRDEFHIARWVVPTVLTAVGLAVFVPLTITVHSLFVLGAFGLPALGAGVGIVCHTIARKITPSQVRLRKRCQKLAGRLIGLKNLLGFGPVLSPRVAGLLEEAAAVYLRSLPSQDAPEANSPLWSEPYRKARAAMDEAIAQILSLAEPESVQAQEVELDRGWAQPLLQEMEATAELLERQTRDLKASALVDGELAPLAGLRDARTEMLQLQSAAEELEQELR
jgi:hypothetical protein